MLKPITAINGQEAGYTLDRSLTCRNKQPCTLTFTYMDHLELPNKLTCMSVDGGRENPHTHTHRQNMQGKSEPF